MLSIYSVVSMTGDLSWFADVIINSEVLTKVHRSGRDSWYQVHILFVFMASWFADVIVNSEVLAEVHRSGRDSWY